MKYRDNTDVIATLIAIPIVIIIFLALALIGAWIGVTLWGAIAVNIFGLPALTFWQFYGLMVLLHILLPSGSVRTSKKEN